MTQKQLKALRSQPVSESGNRIVNACAITGKTQMDCSRATGLTPQYVSDMARGRFRNISIDNARKFAEFFGCHIEDLFPSSSNEAVAS
jgi:transcriptional regulator with XRE-family HTH domain